MIGPDKARFAQAFNRLAVALRLPAAEADAAMQRIYFDALTDLPIEAIEQAAETLARTVTWFPKTSEWRQAANLANVESLVKCLPAERDQEWADECGACHDSGWEQRMCYPGTANNCGRKRCGAEAKEHRYMIPCTCRPTNRTYARHHLPKARAMYSA